MIIESKAIPTLGNYSRNEISRKKDGFLLNAVGYCISSRFTLLTKLSCLCNVGDVENGKECTR